MPGMTNEAVSVITALNQRRSKKRKDGEDSPEDRFDFQLRSYGLPKFERQVRFAKSIGRRWAFDFACAQYMLAVEIEGLVVQRVHIATMANGRVVDVKPELVCRGRHASITGFKEDAIKYASAAQLGWTVLRFEQSQVKDGTAIDMTMRVLYARGWSGPADG